MDYPLLKNIFSRPAIKKIVWSSPAVFFIIGSFSFSFLIYDYLIGGIPTRSGVVVYEDDPARYESAFNIFFIMGASLYFLSVISFFCNLFNHTKYR